MRLLHVLDETCDPTTLQVVETLRAKLSAEGVDQIVAASDGLTAEVTRRFIAARIHRAEARFSRLAAFSPGLKALGQSQAFDLIHAWGPRAASLIAAMIPGRPLVASILDPAMADEAGKRLRALSASVIAGSQVARRQLIERGIVPESIVVIRGPVDFAAINQARNDGVRERLVQKQSPIVLMSGPASRMGDQYSGLWAAAIVSKVLPGLRVILPYESPERARLQAFVCDGGISDMLIPPPVDWPWPKLVACADAFMVCPHADTTVEPIAWAMAAGVPILGTAVRSNAEILADRSNALLCKPGDPRTLAAKLLTVLEDVALRRQISEVARGQAYEVFSTRQFVENYRRVYENVLHGRSPADQVRDTAMVA